MTTPLTLSVTQVAALLGCDKNTQLIWSRIMAKAKPNGECLEWQGSKGKHGHGYIRYEGKAIPVYRVVYLLHHGSIPEGYDVHHKCNNPPCLNIDHLEAVTHKVNMLLSDTPAARNSRKTHCHRGHEFTPENTYHRPSGGRTCRACGPIHWQTFSAKRKQQETA